MHLLACGAHPDDVELGCGGTLALAAERGHEVSVLDLTRGEMGSNGDPESRAREADCAAKVLGLARRENAKLPDGALDAGDPEQRRAIVSWLRRLGPDLLIIPTRENRHPDHREAHRLLMDAMFLAGAGKFEAEGPVRRPARVMQYMERIPFTPSLLVNIDSVIDRKREAMLCYESQFQRKAESAATLINDPEFLEQIIGRNRHFGQQAGCVFAEPFLADAPPLFTDPGDILGIGPRTGEKADE